MNPHAVWGTEYPVVLPACLEVLRLLSLAPGDSGRVGQEASRGGGLPCPLGLLWGAVVLGMDAYILLASPGHLTWGSCHECVFTACCLCILRKVL